MAGDLLIPGIMADPKNSRKETDSHLVAGREKPGHSPVRNPDPDVFESSLRDVDEDDEDISDVPPLKPPHQETGARDPELREDDESPPDIGRVFRGRKRTG